MPTIMLSEHFSLDELTASQTAARLLIPNVPTPIALDNLKKLAERLESVRSLLAARPILISSGYRCPAVNRAVGGAPSSAHTLGLAADFTCPGFGSPVEICRHLSQHLFVLTIDQLIYEFGSWVHLGLANPPQAARGQLLTIDGDGTRMGLG